MVADFLTNNPLYAYAILESQFLPIICTNPRYFIRALPGYLTVPRRRACEIHFLRIIAAVSSRFWRAVAYSGFIRSARLKFSSASFNLPISFKVNPKLL